MNVLTLDRIWKSYAEKTALRDVSFEVEPGGVLAIIGPTGSGKTTLLRIMDLLDRPSSGRMLFDGVEPNDEDARREIRRRMGMVFQQPVLFDSSVYRNVSCALQWRGCDGGEVRKRVLHILSMVGLSDLEGRRARSLSGGERQKVAIASAIAPKPELLLLDEPTANLDPASVSVIEDVVKKINKVEGVTVVLATHNLFQARRLADRVVFLLDGEVVEIGDCGAIFEHPRDGRTASFLKGEMVY